MNAGSSARAGELLAEARRIGVPARIEHVGKIAVDERRGARRPTRAAGRTGNAPPERFPSPTSSRSVLNPEPAQLPERDRGPLVVPAGAERADEVRGQVVDRAAAIGPHVVDPLELAIPRRHPREGTLEPVVSRGRVHAHRDEPGGPEGMAIGIEQPPARAVVMRPEEPRLGLALSRAAPPGRPMARTPAGHLS